METDTDPKKIKDILERGVEEAIDKDNLAKQLASGKQLRIKLGIDPTAADLHLGHSVVLRKLAQFQQMGHVAVLIIGDFTSLIGDPSGRATSRPQLAEAQIRDNMKDYVEQASKIIDIKKAEIHNNSEWFGTKPMSFLMDLAGRFTVARLIEREDFQKRLKDGLDVSMLELLYPLLQGYDSVAIKADVELGGYDQRLNLLFGRKVQRAFGQPEQDILTVPLLIGTDGEKKMSKSVGNYIRIAEEPNKMFTQLMEVDDSQIYNYLRLLTGLPENEIEKLKSGVESKKIHPKDAKKQMAREVVCAYCGNRAGEGAEKEYVRVCEEKQLPTNIVKINVAETAKAGDEVFVKKMTKVVDLLVKLGAVSSKSEARRLCEQSGVKIDKQIRKDCNELVEIKSGMIVQVGKTKFFEVA